MFQPLLHHLGKVSLESSEHIDQNNIMRWGAFSLLIEDRGLLKRETEIYKFVFANLAYEHIESPWK